LDAAGGLYGFGDVGGRRRVGGEDEVEGDEDDGMEIS